MGEVQEMVEELTARGTSRQFYPPCTVGSKLNGIRGSMEPRPGEEPLRFQARVDGKLRAVSAKYGWGCVDMISCASCKKGQESFRETLLSRYPFWLDTHVARVVDRFTRSGPTRELPAFCEIGDQVNRVVSLIDLDDESQHAVLSPLVGQYDCLNTVSCLHCERGQGLFQEVLLDMCENGDAGEWYRAL